MKVKFCCDSGANIKSCREETFDTVKDLGLEEGEWESMDRDAKWSLLEEWAHNKLGIWYAEIKEFGDEF